MIRSIFLCSALVASSAVGALALSVMHDNAYEVQTSRLNAPETSGVFVVPAFAPVHSQPILKTITAPSVAAKTVIPVALAEPEVLFLTPISSNNTYVAPETIAPAPVTRKRSTPKIALPKTAIDVLPTPTKFAPIVVYQVAPIPVAAPAQRRVAVAPSYYIGVYR